MCVSGLAGGSLGGFLGKEGAGGITEEKPERQALKCRREILKFSLLPPRADAAEDRASAPFPREPVPPWRVAVPGSREVPSDGRLTCCFRDGPPSPPCCAVSAATRNGFERALVSCL